MGGNSEEITDMALFDKTTEEKKEQAVKPAAGRESVLANRLLSRPRITEKAYALNALNQYVFEVAKSANKKSVKRAVEEAYGVTVEAVNIVRLPAKKHFTGRNRTLGFKSATKKAVVTVSKGQSIELFKGGI